MTTLRVIHDPPAAGDWNMAVDEMMLESVTKTSESILRFYAWEEPTVSLGYFQTLEDRQSHTASLKCPVVRRSTGGGAIVHDQELTYSIAVPITDRWSPAATGLYESMHQSLVAALGKLGLTAMLCEKTLHDLEPEFLCFQRRAKGDVLVAGHKIAGSAQRRRHGAMLQHGSVILAQSIAAPEILGLQQLGLTTSAAALSAQWLAELRQLWEGAKLRQDEWSPSERARASTMAAERFASTTWLTRRTV